jgi:hypothetical protein
MDFKNDFNDKQKETIEKVHILIAKIDNWQQI